MQRTILNTHIQLYIYMCMYQNYLWSWQIDHNLVYKTTCTAPSLFLTKTKSPWSRKLQTVRGRKSTLAEGPTLNPSRGSTSVRGRETADSSLWKVLWWTAREEEEMGVVLGREGRSRRCQRSSWLSQPMDTRRWPLPRKQRSAMNDWWPIK